MYYGHGTIIHGMKQASISAAAFALTADFTLTRRAINYFIALKQRWKSICLAMILRRCDMSEFLGLPELIKLGFEIYPLCWWACFNSSLTIWLNLFQINLMLVEPMNFDQFWFMHRWRLYCRIALAIAFWKLPRVDALILVWWPIDVAEIEYSNEHGLSSEYSNSVNLMTALQKGRLWLDCLLNFRLIWWPKRLLLGVWTTWWIYRHDTGACISGGEDGLDLGMISASSPEFVSRGWECYFLEVGIWSAYAN